MRRSYKFRCYPNRTAVKSSEDLFRACCNVWNRCIAERRRYYRQIKLIDSGQYCHRMHRIPFIELKRNKEGTVRRSLSAFDQYSIIKKEDNPQYSNYNVRALQMVVSKVNDSYKSYFGLVKSYKKGIIKDPPSPPFFIGWRNWGWFSYDQNFWKINSDRISFSMLAGNFKMVRHREISGDVKTVSIHRESDGKWYVIMSCDNVVPDTEVMTDSYVGVDMGIANHLTCSDGVVYDLPQNVLAIESKISMKHQQLDHKSNRWDEERTRDINQGFFKKGKKSNRYRKLRLEINKLTLRKQRIIDYYIKNTVRDLLRKYDVVCIEDLDIKEMVKKESRGKKRNNKQIRKGLYRGCFAKFRDWLEYKGKELNKNIIAVNPAYTSQCCNVCGHIDINNRRTQANFECKNCGHQDNADLNAAKNIELLGVCSPCVRQNRLTNLL